jgi:hypothetical protein
MQRSPTSRKELNTHQSGRFSWSHAKQQNAHFRPYRPRASGKPRCAFVDTTFAPDERGKRFTIQFVFGTVTEQARPFASRSLVDFPTISGAQDHSGKRFVGGWQVQMLQL